MMVLLIFFLLPALILLEIQLLIAKKIIQKKRIKINKKMGTVYSVPNLS